MIVCPLCEHPQERGAECEVCGRALAAPSVADPPVAPVDGLEPTLHAATPAAAVLPGPFLDLEPTLQAPVDVDAAFTVEVEPTRAPPVDVDGEAVPDLERTAAAIPDDGPTPLPLAAVCRYCRTPALPGERICGRCGMRLPFVPVAAPAAPDVAAGEERRCTDCGALAPGDRCPACGARVARPS